VTGELKEASDRDGGMPMQFHALMVLFYLKKVLSSRRARKDPIQGQDARYYGIRDQYCEKRTVTHLNKDEDESVPHVRIPGRSSLDDWVSPGLF